VKVFSTLLISSTYLKYVRKYDSKDFVAFCSFFPCTYSSALNRHEVRNKRAGAGNALGI
jgi:hypothetical protein